MKTRRKKNIYFGFGPPKSISKRELQKSRTAFRKGVAQKRSAGKKQREKEALTLFRQLQRDSKPQRARRSKYKMSPADTEAWTRLLRSNPHELNDSEISQLRKLVRQNKMAKKKRAKKRKRNSRKGVMPAGLKKYWAKLRGKKNPAKKKRRKRARRRKTNPVRKVVYRTRVRTKTVYRTRRANPKRKRRAKVIRPPSGMSAQNYAKILRRAGIRARVITK
jgi:hypothetical protein